MRSLMSNGLTSTPKPRRTYLSAYQGRTVHQGCGKLLKSMYGTRDAASNWEDCYMDFAKSIRFESGLASPCVIKHKTRKLWLTVHGDDFTILGSDHDLDWFEKKIKEEFEVKIRGRLGPGVRKEEDQSI